MEKQWTLNDDYTVTSYETDARGKASLTTLCKFMQETAYHHAHHLGFGYEHLKKVNTFWVLSRLLIEVDRYPAWDDRITVRTWASGIEGILALRDFRFFDDSGNAFGNATTSWLILDAERRRPQRQDELKKFAHLWPKERSLSRNAEKIARLANPEPGSFFQVRYSDLDLYDHVNNAKYIQWILDSYPEQMLREMQVAAMEINFLAETKIEDEAAVFTEKSSEDARVPEFRHSVRRKADDRDICLARVQWIT